MTLEEEVQRASPATLARLLALVAARLIELSSGNGRDAAVAVVAPLALPALSGEEGPPAPMSGEELKDLRTVHMFTMAQAAKLVGVTERTVWRWEHGISHINPLTVPVIRRKLADAARLRNAQA